MAVRNRKANSNENLAQKSKKELKRAKKDINNTSLANNKYGAILGILFIVFAVIYLVLFGSYVYKRKTGQTTSALRHENPFGNVDMDALRNAVTIDENGNVVFTDEGIKRYKEMFGEAPPSPNLTPKEDENVEEVGLDEDNENENENDNENENENENVNENTEENENDKAAPETNKEDADADNNDTTEEKNSD